MEEYLEEYNEWINNPIFDEETKRELLEIKDDKKEIEDRFYKDLEFGTGGLRGVMGAGSNRMNVYTVAKATQGLAAYVNSVSENGKVAVAYDSRIKSDVFAKTTA
jgi:phosphoglucomutase